jgi:hypothetical protein
MALARDLRLAILGAFVAHGVAPDATGVVAPHRWLENGSVLNSASLNGRNLNGIRMNGARFNGVRLSGGRLGGFVLDGLELAGTRFKARVLGGSGTIEGAALIGSQLEIDVEGQPWELRFDDIRADPSDASGEVLFYEIAVRGPGSGWEWTSLCHDSLGAPTQAIPLANAWDAETGARIDDPGVVTFACRGAALAKCVEWGYHPWATVDGVSLAEHHQACTRMARADYCGDGRSHTLDGTPIDVFDLRTSAIQRASTLETPGWAVEAEWGPDGAVCLGEQLRLSMLAGADHEVPPCLAALLAADGCGDLAAGRGGLVANRYCSQWQDDPQACGL